MTQTVSLPLWLFLLILLFAAVTFASHFLFPSVRWFFRRRLEHAVERLNQRLTRPIEPFKLARRNDMIQRLIYDPEVSAAIVEHARKEGVREDVAFQKARRYAREIVPSFSAFAYFGFGIRAARWLARTLYDVRTDPGNDAVIAELPKDATVIFVMNHRSNMDYVLVTYLAGQAFALSYAVGEWARVWPLSRLIKSMGAYFIRRKSRDGLYRKVLARYVHMATEGGVTQAIFPEGGLSLDGNLAPPKVGLLTYVVQAYHADGPDVIFVPVAINYDRVLEDTILMAAHARGDRRFGARMGVIVHFILRKLWLRITGRFLRFGVAGVVFGKPLGLHEYGGPDDGVDLDMKGLATALMRRIEAVMPVLGVPILCKTLLAAEKPLSDAELLAAAQREVERTGGLLSEPDETVTAVLELALSHLKEREIFADQTSQWWLEGKGRELATFYANSITPGIAENSARAK